MNPIPLSVPDVRGNETKYLQDCIETNWVSYLGPYVTRFEDAMTAFVGSRHAVATNCGTAALHTALLVAGIGSNDEVLVPDLTFIAPINAIRYCGAYPVFIDVDPDYWQMDPIKLASFLKTECRQVDKCFINKKTGRQVKAILPVHLLGHPCDMDSIMALSKEFGLFVIEDAAESLGATYKGRPVGGIGDMGCFSFNGNKIITTGGGGLIATNNEFWAQRVKYLTTQAKDSVTEYIHESIGYNYRLTNIQAAVGVAQMEKLQKFIQIKRQIAERYKRELLSVPGLTLPKEASWAFSTYWLYTIQVDPDGFGVDSRQLQQELEGRGIQSRPLWAPCHEQTPYRDCQAYQIETSPKLYRTALSLPSSVNLTEEDQRYVIAAIKHR